jgi:hypothetical protein
METVVSVQSVKSVVKKLGAVIGEMLPTIGISTGTIEQPHQLALVVAQHQQHFFVRVNSRDSRELHCSAVP